VAQTIYTAVFRAPSYNMVIPVYVFAEFRACKLRTKSEQLIKQAFNAHMQAHTCCVRNWPPNDRSVVGIQIAVSCLSLDVLSQFEPNLVPSY
jgi:hypothetical protein